MMEGGIYADEGRCRKQPFPVSSIDDLPRSGQGDGVKL